MFLHSRSRLAMAALLAAACTDAFRPSSVVVQAPATTIAVQQTIQLSAEPLDANGAPITDRPVTWTSGNASIATVSDSGRVTGIAPGTVTITATIDGTRGSIAITVVAIPVAAVSLVPDTVALVVPNKVQLAAVLTGAHGDTLTNRVVTWLSSHPGLASVDGTGLVTGINEGSVTITATSEGKRGNATVTITVAVESVTVVPGAATLAVGVTQSFYTILTGLPGSILYGREVAWSSSNPAVAIANPTGLVTGKTVGTATITATSEGVSGTATVTVVPCVATVSSYRLVAPLPAVQAPGRTFVRVHDEVVRGAAPPRVPRSGGAPPANPTASAGCGELRPMAWDGQPGPEGGALVALAWANPAAFAGAGRFAFKADINGLARNQGIFVADGSTLRAIAIGCGTYGGGGGAPGFCGDPSPVGGTFSGFFGGTFFAPAANEAGDVLFLADVWGGTTPRALFLYRASTSSIVKIAGVGDPSPVGAILTAVGPGSLNGAGDVAFIALGVNESDQLVLHWSNGVLTKVARTGEPTPSGGTWTGLAFEILGFEDGTFRPGGPIPDIDDAGRVAFLAHAGNTRGIVLWQGGTASWYAQTGEAAPGGGTYVNFWAPSLGAGGEVAFVSDISFPTGASAWYAGKPGDWRKVIGHYSVVDGYPIMGLAVSRNPMQPITPAGDLLAWVAVQLADSTYREQLVFVRRNGTYETVAFQGQPGVPDGVLDRIDPWPSVDAFGRATVSAKMLGGGIESRHFVTVP